MENIISVMVDKFRDRAGKRSIETFREILDKKELSDFDKKWFEVDSFEGKIDAMLLNYLSHAYQKGISAGKKLSDKSDMNKIDAVEFIIKELKKFKDDFKVKIADDIRDSIRYKVVIREAYSSEEVLLGSNLPEKEARSLYLANHFREVPFEYCEMIEEK